MPEHATAFMQECHQQRIRFTNIQPSVDQGRYPAKAVQGDQIHVSATIFRDGPVSLCAAVRYRHLEELHFQQSSLVLLGNDLWEGHFPVERLGLYEYYILAWADPLATWQEKVKRKWAIKDASIAADLADGAALLRNLATRVTNSTQRVKLMQDAALLGDPNFPLIDGVELALQLQLAEISSAYPLPPAVVRSAGERHIWVDRPRAAFAAWYELFPRSQSPQPGEHGTFRDLLPRLPALRELGFDVLYFPPIHPIGLTNRKGKNNAVEADADDVGSPWAIGNWDGGHDAVEPALGTLDDFRMLVQAATAHGLEIALDLALNCSPDHPWVRDFPHWFQRRSDGSIAYAENPPKKYQDVYPLDFDNPDWPALWREILRVVQFWIKAGVKTFRVDNPHTKPIGFWEWLLAEIRRDHADVIFLSEAFTLPAMMKELAKIGFTQSYTYFTWRNTKAELTEYLSELSAPEMANYFRPNFFVNTPDILHAYLQRGGRGAFAVRLFLAATLSPLYGLYSGFEFYENQPLHEGSEEYLNSEKYELIHRPAEVPGSLHPLIRLLNRARQQHAALQRLTGLHFHSVNNDQLLCYHKSAEDSANVILCVVNLDPHRVQDGMVDCDLAKMRLPARESFQVHDLITNQSWTWKPGPNYVRLDPQTGPAHLFVVRLPVRHAEAVSRHSHHS